MQEWKVIARGGRYTTHAQVVVRSGGHQKGPWHHWVASKRECKHSEFGRVIAAICRLQQEIETRMNGQERGATRRVVQSCVANFPKEHASRITRAGAALSSSKSFNQLAVATARRTTNMQQPRKFSRNIKCVHSATTLDVSRYIVVCYVCVRTFFFLGGLEQNARISHLNKPNVASPSSTCCSQLRGDFVWLQFFGTPL